MGRSVIAGTTYRSVAGMFFFKKVVLGVSMPTTYGTNSRGF